MLGAPLITTLQKRGTLRSKSRREGLYQMTPLIQSFKRGEIAIHKLLFLLLLAIPLERSKVVLHARDLAFHIGNHPLHAYVSYGFSVRSDYNQNEAHTSTLVVRLILVLIIIVVAHVVRSRNRQVLPFLVEQALKRLARFMDGVTGRIEGHAILDHELEVVAEPVR